MLEHPAGRVSNGRNPQCHYIRNLLRREAELRAAKRATNRVDQENADKLRRLRLRAELTLRGTVATLTGPSLFDEAVSS